MRDTVFRQQLVLPLAFVLLDSCGGDVADNQNLGSNVSSGGQASSAGGTGHTTGGSSFLVEDSGILVGAGCPGQPPGQPPAPSQSAGGITYGTPYTDEKSISGFAVNVLEEFITPSSVDASSCVYGLPASMPFILQNTGLGFREPMNLSVWFTNASGAAEMFPNVAAAGSCTDSGGGWYLNDNSSTTPAFFTLCPCTCSRMNSIAGTLDVIDFPPVIIS